MTAYRLGATKGAADLYEHAARAIECGIEVGAHGLPLIRTGDWNDGMDRVGDGGHGESAWLAWFRIATVAAFAPPAEARGDAARAARWRKHAAGLSDALDANASYPRVRRVEVVLGSAQGAVPRDGSRTVSAAVRPAAPPAC